MKEPVHLLAEQLFRFESERRRGRMIQHRAAPFGIDGENPFVRRIEEQLQLAEQSFAIFFRCVRGGDIARESVDLATVRVAANECIGIDENPAIAAA